MARNNDVFQVLVTKDNANVLPAGQRLGNLVPGQIGVFNYDTNISIDGTVPTRNFYLAVATDDDVIKSSGSHIQNKNIQFYSYRSYTPGQAMVVVLRDYTADCETEYGIKLELRNQEIYRSQGYNQFTKSYTMVTGCCDGCAPTCPSGDANEITRQLVINITNDPLGLVTADAIARQAITILTHGTSVDYVTGDVVSAADLDAIMAYNALQADPADYIYTDLQITTVTQAVNKFCSINLKYFYPRETIIIPSKIEGFKCNGTLEVTQQAAFEEGAGYDIQQREYEASGWKQGHYRLSTLNGVANDIEYNALKTGKYDQIALTYDQFSIGAWLEYYNNQATCIAIPTVDTATRDTLLTVLDALLTPSGFNALADDAAASIVDVNTVERTTDIDDVNLDGIA
jgi:hypothetical protein